LGDPGNTFLTSIISSNALSSHTHARTNKLHNLQACFLQLGGQFSKTVTLICVCSVLTPTQSFCS
jgi:hypothetical protein